MQVGTRFLKNIRRHFFKNIFYDSKKIFFQNFPATIRHGLPATSKIHDMSKNSMYIFTSLEKLNIFQDSFFTSAWSVASPMSTALTTMIPIMVARNPKCSISFPASCVET